MFDFRFEIWVELEVVLLNRQPLEGFTDDGSVNLLSLYRHMLFPKNETMKLLLAIMALREFNWWFVIATPKHFAYGLNMTKNP